MAHSLIQKSVRLKECEYSQGGLRSSYHKVFAVKGAFLCIFTELNNSDHSTVLLSSFVAWNWRVPIQCCCHLMFTNDSVYKEQAARRTSTDYLVFIGESKLVRTPYFSQGCCSENMHANLTYCWGLGESRGETGRAQISKSQASD